MILIILLTIALAFISIVINLIMIKILTDSMKTIQARVDEFHATGKAIIQTIERGATRK